MNNDLNHDIRTYRIVVAVLALTVAASMAGAIFVALGSAAIGGPAGLLAPSSLTR